MLRTKFALSLASISLAFSASCGGGSGGGSQIDIEDFCAENTGAFSQFVGKLAECTPEIEIIFGGAPSEASIAAACNAQFGNLIDDGSVELGEQVDLDACIAAILAADCDTLEVDDVPECDALLVGNLATGEICESSDQCEGEAYCTDPASGATCGGCMPLLADGESCEDSEECLSNNCRSGGVCGGFSGVGESCETAEDCAGRLICQGTTCELPAAASVGDACTEFIECGFPVSNLYCNGQAMMCEAFIPLGGDCFDGSIALGFCDLVKYESCDTEGTRKCVAPTIVAMGGQCGFAMGLKCDSGLICDDDSDGVCVATGEGAACDPEKQTCGLFLECKDNGVCGYEDEYTGMCSGS